MAKLVDAPDLGSGIERRVGSSPTWGTINCKCGEIGILSGLKTRPR